MFSDCDEALSPWRVQNVQSVSSTMDTLRGLLRERLDQTQQMPEETEYVAVRADMQSEGRGRRGRSWQSEKGNLFLSFALPFEEESTRYFEVSFACAVALEETIQFFCPTAVVTLKWPNDLLFQGRKLSGILIEGYQEGSCFFLLIGVGVNLVSAPCLKEEQRNQRLSYEGSCLKEMMTQASQSVPSLEDFTSRFLSFFWQIEKERKGKGFSVIRQKWLKKSFAPGTVLTISTDRGLISAPFLDLDGQGRLLLGDTYETATAFSAGDVIPI